MPSKGNKSVLFFAALVAILILLSAYCTERNGLIDEPGFLNPAYMMAHYGKITFPTYPHNKFFDVPVITHPPMHVGLIGMFWRFGMPPYYAEATPTVLMFFLAILIIVTGPFPTPVKLGWLFSIGFLATSGETLTLCFGTRPEGELHAAWFSGLLLLESGRLANWQRWRLFAGAFLLTWTSGTHYYAGPALLGVIVYIVWAVRSLGPKDAKPRVIAMCAGGALYGIPYLAFYILPYLHEIRTAISENQGAGGIGASIRNHVAMYRSWAHAMDRPVLIRQAMAIGAPLWVISTTLLLAVRSTRGIALAALPLQLGLFFFAWHKMPYYMVHESVIFAAALAIALLSLCWFLVSRYLPKLTRFCAPLAAAVLTFCLISGSPMLARADFSLQPRFNETEIAQAAGRRMMGPNARVGGRWWGWYAGGAKYWFDVDRDLAQNFTLLNPDAYIPNLDAIQTCVDEDEHLPYYDWFADGRVKLRGFFFGQSNVHLRCLLLAARQASPLVGYAEWNDRLYRFQEDPGGDYYVLSTICPDGGHEDWHNPWNGSFSSSMRLADGPSGAPRTLVTTLTPQAYLAPSGRVGLGCRDVARTRGKLLPEDRRALMAWARSDDSPIHFLRGVDEMPGYRGIGLPPDAIAPPDAVPVPNVVDLAAITPVNGAKAERAPDIRVTTVPLPGGFSAVIPLRNAAAVTSPCWVVLKLRVIHGRVGFAAAMDGGGLLTHTQAIAPSPKPQVVALKVPDIRQARSIILFNQSLVAGTVDILDAGVVVAPAK
uniref:Uncharacterized protein n=1 Tax=Solibacter usitatus (strain Ellin6076) TaxID=234267 RepID=Q02BJ5_SOLUE